MARETFSLSAATDIAAIGFELPQTKGWKRAFQHIRDQSGTLAVYEMIREAGKAFSEATRLERVDWEKMDQDWDEYLMDFVQKIVNLINDEDYQIDLSVVIPSEELLPLAREILGGAEAESKTGKVPRTVKSVADLKKILTSGDPEGPPHEFTIMLTVGRSSKQMHYNDPKPGWYWVYNEIDGTEQEIKGDRELARKTNIVDAIKKGAFIYQGQQG